MNYTPFFASCQHIKNVTFVNNIFAEILILVNGNIMTLKIKVFVDKK